MNEINNIINKIYLLKEDIKNIKNNIHCKGIMKKYDYEKDCMIVRIHIECDGEIKVIDKHVYDWGIINTKINAKYNNILDGFYSVNSCEDIRKCLEKLKFDDNKYSSLVNKDSYTYLKYDEYLILLIYKVLGMDKSRNIDRYNSNIDDILNHIKNRSQYIDKYAQHIDKHKSVKSNVSLEDNTGVCIKCGGTGYLEQYHDIEHGRCFSCDGTGRDLG